jgi:perosamine synthetase
MRCRNWAITTASRTCNVRWGSVSWRNLHHLSLRRQQIVDAYNRAFADLEWLQRPVMENWITERTTACTVGWHLYSPQIDFAGLGVERNAFMEALRRMGVGSQVLYIPVHLQPFYRSRYGYGPGLCPRAEATFQRTLSLPLFPAMTDDEVQQVIQCVRSMDHGGGV